MDEDLRARLRRLRREGQRDAAEPPRAEVPAWARRRLGARRRTREGAASEPAHDPERGGPVTTGPPADLERDAAGVAARTVRYDGGHRHGAWRLAEVAHADTGAIALAARDPRLAELDLARAVYLDIETNGLAGGAGTYPFLVALGTFDADGGFELWQGFLHDPSEEPALLAEVARRVAAAGAVVSFFGKVFDKTRLEDKMRLHGVAAPFDGLPHLDLFHPLRGLYGADLPDARLQRMERELCGVAREDDLPGSFAPAAWLDHMAARPHRLEAVFRHNADDVLSLVVLAAHIGRALQEARHDGAPLEGPARARAEGLARACHVARDRGGELGWVERALERAPGDRRLELWRADLWRTDRGSTDGGTPDARPRALEAYLALGEVDDALSARAWLEAAKLHEHLRRDPAAALEACARARRAVARHLPGVEGVRLLEDLDRREARLAARVEGG